MPNSALSSRGGSGITALTGDVTAAGSGSQAASIPTSVISTFMRTVTDDANGPAALTTLGLSTARVTVQFDTTSNTFATVTGLSKNVVAGHVYDFLAKVYFTLDATGWGGLILGGSATATIIGDGAFFNANGTGNVEPTGVFVDFAGSNKNLGATDIGTSSLIYCGTLTVSVNGSFDVQFRQSGTPGGSPSSVLVGSTLTIRDIT